MIPDELKNLIEDHNADLKPQDELKQSPEKTAFFDAFRKLKTKDGPSTREEFLKWRQDLINMK